MDDPVVVGRDENSAAGGGGFDESGQDDVGRVVVEIARRLIGEDDARSQKEGTADAHTLSLPPTSPLAARRRGR